MKQQNETLIYGSKASLIVSYASLDSPEIQLFEVEDDSRVKARQQTVEVDMSKHQNGNFALVEHLIDVYNEKVLPAIPIELEAKHLDIIFKIYKYCE